MFTEEQKNILPRANIHLERLSEERVFEIAHRQVDEGTLSDNELVEFLKIANALYRGGHQIITDAEYDFTFIAELRVRHPSHPFLQVVEPESAYVGKTVDLPVRMLSTEKAYTHDEIKAWVGRIRKAANETGIEFSNLIFRVTPKLDGFAAYDDGQRLYTRGDGRRGTDITRVFDRGLVVANDGKRGLGAGEIVVRKDYFDEYLSPYFENTRNFQASVVKEKELEEHAAKAIIDKAAVFYPFALLPSWEKTYQELESDYENIITSAWNSVEFDVDGVILEICNDELKRVMGATRHHYRWQIAFKKNVENARVKVLRVLPQTSRSGRINPVAEIEPTRLSGAMIKRATAHHYGMVNANGIGSGAVIELTRSGEVIPKIVKVIVPAEPDIPEICPSCKSDLIWDGDYLYCTNNIECPAQIAHTIEHFFKTLGNVDGFGSATIEKFYNHGIRSVFEVYGKTTADFQGMGFGPKQSENLYNELIRSRLEKIEDWRFLAAFGVFRMGTGNCERLLSHHPLEDLFNLDNEHIVAIEGFAEKTAEFVVKGLNRIQGIFNSIYNLGFNLERTPLVLDSNFPEITTPISGKLIVFTGAMTHGSRSDMQAEAKRLGAKVGSSVTGKTDLLVAGENVGATKITDAEARGVSVITEEQYLALIRKVVASS
ncbi:MAG: helix-hairpin-helix domain-containing protein [Methylobacter sp.]|uniref:DNA ligase n=1 Tax=Candidatus Methylobacter titanis TaxID=3053457 RepID=A0AA43Q4L4_9GAMM|nr:helix-hairpin-helix domain-containing protein [Candidatus Methylobacter titanis]